jgi:hypothetical protein
VQRVLRSPAPDVRFTLVRRSILAFVVVTLTLAGHASGRGELPNSVGVTLAVLIAVGLTLTATARQRSWPWLIAFLLGAQLLIHVVLVIATPHAHGSMPLLPTGATAVGHLVASLIAAAVLAHGEDVLIAWSRLLSATFEWAMPGVRVIEGVGAVKTAFCEWTPIPSDRGWDADRRGPPRVAPA